MKERDDSGAGAGGKPGAEIKNYAGKEAGFGGAEKKPQRIERGGGMYGVHAARDDAPADHEGGDPAAGADALQRQVGGNLKQKIAEEENSRAEAVDRVAEAELGLHLQGGEGRR